MAKITFGDTDFELLDDESVLAGMLRNGINAPHNCQSGVCQTCLMQAHKPEPGVLPSNAQANLPKNMKARGYFLACQCRPTQDLTIEDEELNSLFKAAIINDKHIYNNSVCRLRLSKPDGFHYRPGQFINVKTAKDNTLRRSYSLASHPEQDDFLEIQVRHKHGGVFSAVLYSTIEEHDILDIQGPNGDFFYSSEASKNLLLVATGTGISPIFGVLKDALHKQHQGEIHVYYGSHNIEGLYLFEQLKSFGEKFKHFKITASLSGEDSTNPAINPSSSIRAGRANEIAFDQHKSLQNFDVYLCGNPSMVQTAHTQAYLNGAAMQNIYSDPFEYQDLRNLDREVE